MVICLLYQIRKGTFDIGNADGNICKALLYERAKDLPPNPTTIDEELPDRFGRTLVGENFLIYDSFEDEDYDLPCGRIIVFATLANLKILFKSNIWYLDGTFRVAPTLFSSCLR